MTVFVLAVLRLSWRWISPPPPLEKNVSPLIKWAATNNIRLLYVLIFLYPLSGYLMSTLGGHQIDLFGLYTIEALGKVPEISKRAHFIHVYVFEYLLIASFCAHVLGAIYHHFIRKDQTLKKMI